MSSIQKTLANNSTYKDSALDDSETIQVCNDSTSGAAPSTAHETSISDHSLVDNSETKDMDETLDSPPNQEEVLKVQASFIHGPNTSGARSIVHVQHK